MSARRRGLGRGLDALLQPDAGDGLTRIPLDRLQPNRRQPRGRFDEESLAELADSIRSQGLVQPIVVTPEGDGTYTIIAGERRFRAAGRAGLDEIPAVVRQVDDDRELLEMALVENLQRADLGPLEEAGAFHSLAEEFGLSHEEIGRRVGKSRAAISNSLRLLKLPEEVRELLASGELTAGQARPLVTVDDEEEAVDLARRAVRENLSARAVENLARDRPAGGRSRRKERKVDVHTAEAEGRLTRALQTRVVIQRRGNGGSVRLHFYSEEELMRLFDLLMDAGGKG